MGFNLNIFAPTGMNEARLFLILFCGTLAMQLALHFREQLTFFHTQPTRIYGNPLPLLGRYRMPNLSTKQFSLAGFGLLLSLLGTMVGIAPRLFLLVALCCYFLYFSQIMPLAYVQRKTNLIPMVLFILLFSPAIEQPLSQPAPLWPIVLVKMAIAQMYFSAGLQKVRNAGLKWGNGRCLQAYLMEHYLWGDTPAALWLASHPQLCRLLSCLVWLFELTFWLILIFPGLTCGYVLGSIVFHIGTAVTMRIHYLKYLSPVYMVFVAPLLIRYIA